MLRRVLDSPWTYFGLAALLALVGLFSLFQARFSPRPGGTVERDLASLRDRHDVNVVFILIDTLRADRLSGYGYQRPTSPTLDRLAADGIRFEQVQSQSSWTKASMASIWTALFPQHSGVTRYDHGLPESATLPAEIFRQAGFATAGIWRNGWVASNFGFAQGFDIYLRPVPREDTEHVERKGRAEAEIPGTDEDVTLAALEFLRTATSVRFMLYLHYMDLHQYVYDDEAAALPFGTSISDVYDRSIHWTDRNVRAVLDALDQSDLRRRTLVIVAADHGEAFGEHGGEGHARDLYQEVVHVPLILSLPFRIDGGLVVSPLVRNVDIWPTVLDLLGLPGLGKTDGVSLVPMIRAAARGERASVPPAEAYLDQAWGKIDNPGDPLVAIQRDRQRVIFNRTDRDKTLEVFDLATDPRERRNLRDTPPPWAKELEQKLDASTAETPPWGETKKVDLNEMELNQLRALGYVIGEGQVGQKRMHELDEGH